MEKLTLDLPAMYGDHHVSEVRRILLEMPGVEAVYASSCFQVVEVKFDPALTCADAITARLGKAGYLGGLSAPLETGEAAVSPDAGAAYFRHTVAYKQTGRVIGFTQNVGHTGRDAPRRTALWPCPGMGTMHGELAESMETTEDRDGEERA